MKTILVLNGSNLNLLGVREPEIFGLQTLADVESICAAACASHGVNLDFRQTNHEGVLVDVIQEAAHAQASGALLGVILNAGAYSHTSIALHDAIKGSGVTLIELHITNIHARESFRHKSFIAPVAKAIVEGFGVMGYALAIDGLVALQR